MSLKRFSLLLVGVAAVAACDDDDNLGPAAPVAYVRVVHAAADTCRVDVRVVDIVQNLPSFNMSLGDVTTFQGVEAGTRRFRVFPNVGGSPTQPDPGNISQILLDTTLTLTAERYHTLVYTGSVAANNDKIEMIVEEPSSFPTPNATGLANGQIALRVVNLAPSLGNLDIMASTTTTTTADAPFTGGVFTFQNVPGVATTGFRTAYQLLAVRDTGATGVTAEPTYELEARAAGSSAATAIAGLDANVPIGIYGTAAANPIGGAQVPGSVISAFVFPTARAGNGCGFSSTNNRITYTVDRQPPRTSS